MDQESVFSLRLRLTGSAFSWLWFPKLFPHTIKIPLLDVDPCPFQRVTLQFPTLFPLANGLPGHVVRDTQIIYGYTGQNIVLSIYPTQNGNLDIPFFWVRDGDR